MTAETEDIGVMLRALLMADAPFAALIGGRIYPGKLPQEQTMPALTYSIISGGSTVTTDGADGLANPRVQIDSWGSDYLQMVNAFDAVRKILNGHSGPGIQGIFLVARRDLYDNEPALYRRSADFQIWHEESV